MQCCVPFCKNTSNNVLRGSHEKGDGKRISFHCFPREKHLCTAWLKALGIRDTRPPASAVVCSQHFLSDDMLRTEDGLRDICTGAIPSTLQVCMACLQTDCELLLLSKHKLEESYVKLTGYPLHDQRNLKRTVCVKCAERLTNFSRFRDESLRARSLMMDLAEKHDFITINHGQMLHGTVLQPDACDAVKEEYCVEDELTELDKTVCSDWETYVVKYEDCCESVSGQSDDEEFPYNGCVLAMALQDDALVKSVTREPLPPTRELNEDSSADSYSSADALLTAMPGEDNKDASGNSAEARAGDVSEPSEQSCCGSNRAVAHSGTVTTCVVKLYDVVKYPKVAVPTRDAPLTSPRGADSCDRRKVDTAAGDAQRHATRVPDATTATGRGPGVSKAPRSDGSVGNGSLVATRPFTCDTCRTSFNRRSTLVKHLKSHSDVKQFECSFCQYKTKYKRSLVNHLKLHTGYSCELCSFKTAINSHLTCHVRSVHGVKPFSCKLCDFKATKKITLVKHSKSHRGKKPYSCNLCSYTARYPSDLVVHMRTHTGEKPYSCNLCSYTATQTGALVLHMRTHTGEKPYSCNLCSYTATQTGALVKHIMQTHTGEKPYSCNLCSYTATQTGALVQHMRTHTGEKPYSCNLCSYTATQKCALVRHMKSHTGEKPYCCKFCDYRAIQKSDLVIHMRSHTGEKPYFCKLCDYRAKRTSHLVKHMRTHTGEKP